MTRNGEEWLSLKTTNQQQYLTSCKPLGKKKTSTSNNHPCKIPSFPTPHAAPQPLLPFHGLFVGVQPTGGGCCPPQFANVLGPRLLAQHFTDPYSSLALQPWALLTTQKFSPSVLRRRKKKSPFTENIDDELLSIKVRLPPLRAILL